MADYTQAVVQPSPSPEAMTVEPLMEQSEGDAAPHGPEVLVFRHEGSLYAVPVARVDAIIGWRPPVEVPAGARALAGLVQHEGRVVAVTHGEAGRAQPSGRTPSRIIVCPTRYGLIGLPATSTVGVTGLVVGAVLEGASVVDTVDGPARLVDPDSLAATLTQTHTTG